MRRRMSLLLAALLAGTLVLFGPAQPASAVVVCAGAGSVTVNPGLLHPGLISVMDPGLDHTVDVLIGNQVNALHAFTLNFGSTGACVHVDASPTVVGLTGNGTLLGFCGHSTGTGTINSQAFSYVSAGTYLLFTGGVVGAATAIPTPLTGSCLHAAVMGTTTFGLPGGATQFQVQGAAVGLNCASTSTLTAVLVPPSTTHMLLLPTQDFGLHTGYTAHVTATQCTGPNPLL